jgi:uncharacterized membrane protein YidH (DUF202 family)
MKNFPNANQLSGRAIGSIFFAGFGTGWLFLSLTARQQIAFVTVSAVMSGVVILIGTALYLMHAAKRWPRVPEDPAIRRGFAWVNAIQWSAIAVVAISFSKLHLDAYVTSAIAGIAGLHMFPLARLFRYPLHYATGTVLVGWAVVSATTLPLEEMQGVTALGTGIILWLSAAVTLAIGLRLARRALPAEAVA